MSNLIKKKSRASKVPQRNRSTGPVTESGKTTSSMNAVTHGATSAKLLTDAEHHRYTTFLAELKESYPESNPLVRMQLERIAKLKVQ